MECYVFLFWLAAEISYVFYCILIKNNSSSKVGYVALQRGGCSPPEKPAKRTEFESKDPKGEHEQGTPEHLK